MHKILLLLLSLLCLLEHAHACNAGPTTTCMQTTMANRPSSAAGLCGWWNKVVACVKDNGCCSNPQLKAQLDASHTQLSALLGNCKIDKCTTSGSPTPTPTSKPTPTPTSKPSSGTKSSSCDTTEASSCLQSKMTKMPTSAASACGWWDSIILCVNKCCDNAGIKSQLESTSTQLKSVLSGCKISTCEASAAGGGGGGKTPATSASPVKQLVYFVLKIAGLDMKSFESTSVQKSFRIIIAQMLDKICGFDGKGECTADDVAIKGFHKHARRANTQVDFSVSVFSPTKAKEAQTNVKAGLAKSSFANDFNKATGAKISGADVISTTTTPVGSGSSGANVGLIIGIVLACVAVLVLIAILVYCILQKRSASTPMVKLDESGGTETQKK